MKTKHWIALCTIAVAVAAKVTPAHPADADLRDLLARQRPAFTELVSMLGHDKDIVRLTPKFILWADGNATGAAVPGFKQRSFEAARWDRYKDLLSAIGSSDGIVVKRDAGVIVFGESVRGALLTGTSKGIAFRYKPALASWIHVVPSLDKDPSEDGQYMCPIIDPWHIYFYSG